MADERVQRRLAAILAADVVGYSRLMGSDETGTLKRLKAVRREIFAPTIAEFGGRIFKLTGDGAFAEFGSATNAVNSAVAIQRVLAERGLRSPDHHGIKLRIGISLGDVIVEGSDLYGNGVNVAARMEGLAEPGGICISANVYEHVGRSRGLAFEDLGDQTVKNIERPVRCYRVQMERSEGSKVGAQSPGPATMFSDKPSIAVLPFGNLSGDPEQEYFSDGITEDIITALSRIRQFFVIARNTTFTFRDRAVDVQRIATELSVRYVLEGSVRKSGNRVRITAQLIDGQSGNHLWADKYDRQLEDIFDVQDEITQTVVGAIEPELNRAERERALRAPPENLDAWEHLHRGMWHFYKFEKSAILEAQGYLRRAIEIDPTLARAYAGLAQAEFVNFLMAYTNTPSDALKRGLEAAKRAVALDERDSGAWAILGVLHLGRREHAVAIEALKTALTVNPSSATAHHWLGLVYAFDGRSDDAIAEQELATRLSPNDPLLWGFMNVRAYAYLHSGRFEEAAKWAVRATQQPNSPQLPYVVHIVALSNLDRADDARRAAETLVDKFPAFSIATVRERVPFHRNEDLEMWVEGLRKAGFSE